MKQEYQKGDVISQSYVKYTYVGTEPYTRRDGTETVLQVWDAKCADCGAPFMTKSVAKTVAMNKRCQKCKKPGVAVTKAGKARVGRFMRKNKKRGDRAMRHTG